MPRRTSIVAATVFTTAFALSACGGGDSKTASSNGNSSSTPTNASQSASDAPQASGASYLKGGKVNPLAVTQDNVKDACTKLLGDPTKLYAGYKPYAKNSGASEPTIDTNATYPIVGWAAQVTNWQDQNGHYNSFTCSPANTYGDVNMPGITVIQYTDGSGVNAKDPVTVTPPFHTPDYGKVVDGKVTVVPSFLMDRMLTTSDGQARLAQYVSKGRGYQIGAGAESKVLSSAETIALVNKWSDKRVSLVKPFVDKASANVTAG